MEGIISSIGFNPHSSLLQEYMALSEEIDKVNQELAHARQKEEDAIKEIQAKKEDLVVSCLQDEAIGLEFFVERTYPQGWRGKIVVKPNPEEEKYKEKIDKLKSMYEEVLIGVLRVSGLAWSIATNFGVSRISRWNDSF